MRQALKQEEEVKKKREENAFVDAPRKHNIALPIDKFEDLEALNKSLGPVRDATTGEMVPSQTMIDMVSKYTCIYY